MEHIATASPAGRALDLPGDDRRGVRRRVGRRGGRVPDVAGSRARDPGAHPDDARVRGRGGDRVEGREEPRHGPPRDRELHGQPAAPDRLRLADDLRGRGPLLAPAPRQAARRDRPRRRPRGRGPRPAAAAGATSSWSGRRGASRSSTRSFLVATYVAYLVVLLRLPPRPETIEEDEEVPAVSRWALSFTGWKRWAAVGGLFVVGGAIIFVVAEPFLALDAGAGREPRHLAVRLHPVGRAVRLGVPREDLRLRLGAADHARARSRC